MPNLVLSRPMVQWRRVTLMMFQTFNVPAMYLGISAVLALYSAGRTTGVVVDSGDSVTHAVPIYEGYAMPHAIQRLDIAGRDVYEKLKRLLSQRRGASDPDLGRYPRRELANVMRDILRRHAFVARDFRKEMDGFDDAAVRYALPDGRLICVGSERFSCAECVFDPSTIGFSAPGISDVTYTAIMHCDADVKKSLFDSIVLAGATTMLRGFAERLEAELIKMAPTTCRVHVRPNSGSCTAWHGGSALASLKMFDKMWITRQEFEDEGPTIVHKKCF